MQSFANPAHKPCWIILRSHRTYMNQGGSCNLIEHRVDSFIIQTFMCVANQYNPRICHHLKTFSATLARTAIVLFYHVRMNGYN
jgi:hypothetical protein